MTIEPSLYYTLLISLIILVGVIVVLSHYMLTLAKSIKELQTHVQDEDESTDRVRHKLQSTYAKALGRNAHAVQEVLSVEFKNHMQQLEQEEEERMQQAVNSLLRSMTEGLQTAQAEHIKGITNAAKYIEDATMSEMELFKKTIASETVGTQKHVEEEVKSAYQNVLKEITAYKEQKLKAIDDQILSIVQRVSKDAIGKSLNLEDHQELIMSSLKKAKQEGFFE